MTRFIPEEEKLPAQPSMMPSFDDLQMLVAGVAGSIIGAVALLGLAFILGLAVRAFLYGSGF